MSMDALSGKKKKKKKVVDTTPPPEGRKPKSKTKPTGKPR